MGSLTNVELLRRARAGSEPHFHQLWARYSKFTRRYAEDFLNRKSPQSLEDVLTQAQIVAFDAIRNGADADCFISFARKVIKNLCILDGTEGPSAWWNQSPPAPAAGDGNGSSGASEILDQFLDDEELIPSAMSKFSASTWPGEQAVLAELSHHVPESVYQVVKAARMLLTTMGEMLTASERCQDWNLCSEYAGGATGTWGIMEDIVQSELDRLAIKHRSLQDRLLATVLFAAASLAGEMPVKRRSRRKTERPGASTRRGKKTPDLKRWRTDHR